MLSFMLGPTLPHGPDSYGHAKYCSPGVELKSGVHRGACVQARYVVSRPVVSQQYAMVAENEDLQTFFEFAMHVVQSGPPYMPAYA